MKRFARYLLGGSLMTLGLVASARAEFTPPSVSTVEYIAVAGVIFTALGAIWGYKKVVKLLNRT